MARNSCFIVRVLCVPLTWHFSPCDSWSQGCWSCCQCLLQPRQPPQCLHAHGESLLLCVCRGAQVCVWQISQWHSKVRLTWCWCLGFSGGFEFNFFILSHALMSFYHLYCRTSHPLLHTSHQRTRKTNKLTEIFSTTHCFLFFHFGRILGHGP